MKLDGFGISGYRSFGQDMTFIHDLGKVNVFIGKNNSGKSNILRFCTFLPEIQKDPNPEHFNRDLDYCVALTDKRIEFAVQIKRDSAVTGGIYSRVSEMLPQMSKRLPEWKDNIWIGYTVPYPSGSTIPDVDGWIVESGRLIANAYEPRETDQLSNKHLGRTGGEPQRRAEELAAKIKGGTQVPFRVKMIEAHRQLLDGPISYSARGKTLIQELRDIQSPQLPVYQSAKDKFNTINNFLRELLGEPDALMEIPAQGDDLYVTIRGRILPLHSLGAGIHELITLAAEVTIAEDVMFCIEEPELHMHPELQKRFIRYIQDKTQNQYLIATHSNAFLDIDGVNVYHCTLVDQVTRCELVTTDTERHGILSDLGYKASDLLQANFVVWVEGPSDRYYLRHWISHKDPSLVEGLDYSIMFYGGDLLSHLAFNSPEIGEFVRLSRLSQNAAIVIDSDMEAENSPIGKTKERVSKDFVENKLFAWITEGREIENYIPEATFNACREEVHPRVGKPVSWERFGRMTNLEGGRSIDKVAVAKKVVQKDPDFSILGLGRTIDELVGHIKRANS